MPEAHTLGVTEQAHPGWVFDEFFDSFLQQHVCKVQCIDFMLSLPSATPPTLSGFSWSSMRTSHRTTWDFAGVDQ
eukprot:3453666-Amphidinium_carterae.1